jgi:hypothetical protein
MPPTKTKMTPAQKLQAAEKKKIEKRAAVLVRKITKEAATAEKRAERAALLAKRAATSVSYYSSRDPAELKKSEMDNAVDRAYLKAKAQGNQTYQFQQIDEKKIEKRVAAETRKRASFAASAAKKAQAAADAAKHAALRAAKYINTDFALVRAQDQAWEKKNKTLENPSRFS